MLEIAYSPIYKYSVPEGHRFPMEKYSLLPEQLLYEGTVSDDNFFAPGRVTDETILLTHEFDYWNRLKNQQLSKKEIRAIGFPMTEELVTRGTYISKGTIECAEFALRHGVAMNIARSTHHSFSYKGEGFCLLNDIAIASNFLLKKRRYVKNNAFVLN